MHHNAASKRKEYGVHVDNNGKPKRLATVLTYLSDVASGAPARRCCRGPVGLDVDSGSLADHCGSSCAASARPRQPEVA